MTCIRLAATVVLGVALWRFWVGIDLGFVSFGGLRGLLGGTWLWDLRYPLVPAYAVFALWVTERVGGALRGRP